MTVDEAAEARREYQLNAGSELNGLVAERLMGWTRWADLSGDAPEGVTCFADWGDRAGVAVYAADDETGDPALYFDPSGDIGDAWEVVKRLRVLGVWTEIHARVTTDTVYVQMGVPSSECQAWGESAALAVSRCALIAARKFADHIAAHLDAA